MVYRVVIPAAHRETLVPATLGYARPSYARAFVRSWETLVQLSRDVGEPLVTLILENEASAVSDWRRIEREHLTEAALELAAAVEALPAPVRDVVVMRAVMGGWNRVFRALPGRVYFSVLEDHRHAVQRLWERHGDAVRRIL